MSALRETRHSLQIAKSHEVTPVTLPVMHLYNNYFEFFRYYQCEYIPEWAYW